jgi:periplasmic divalent cation tolerance protein
MDARLIYMTAGSKAEAETIGRQLVESRLVACVNIIDNMRSFYIWKDEVQDDREIILIAKTVKEHVQALTEKVQSLHSYECPCVVSIPIEDGNPDFLKWIGNEVETWQSMDSDSL